MSTSCLSCLFWGSVCLRHLQFPTTGLNMAPWRTGGSRFKAQKKTHRLFDMAKWRFGNHQMNDLVKKRESSWNEIIEVNPMQLDSDILRLSWRFLVDISVGIEHNDATHQEEQDLKVGEDAERNLWLLDEVFRSLIRFLVFDFLIFLYFCLKPASARFVVSFLWLNFVCSWRKANESFYLHRKSSALLPLALSSCLWEWISTQVGSSNGQESQSNII